jgi:hypothetical protein
VESLSRHDQAKSETGQGRDTIRDRQGTKVETAAPFMRAKHLFPLGLAEHTRGALTADHMRPTLARVTVWG